MPFTYEFIDNGDSFTIVKDGVYYAAAKNLVEMAINGEYLEIRSNSARATKFNIQVGTDTIIGVGSLSTDPLQLYTALLSLFFLDDSGNSSQSGFIDYNDATGAFSITSDTWTDLPNDGQGAFSNNSYPPSGVTDLMDVSTGYIDPTELSLGDTILIRNDYTINPNTNNALVKFRYALGNGGSSYTLEKIIGRLDSGSGQDYRFSLAPDLIYMGDTNTRDNHIKIQVYCTSNATVTNAGSVIQVIKR